MSSNVPVAEATCYEAVLPERVQDALGSWLGQRRRGFWRSALASGWVC